MGEHKKFVMIADNVTRSKGESIWTVNISLITQHCNETSIIIIIIIAQDAVYVFLCNIEEIDTLWRCNKE